MRIFWVCMSLFFGVLANAAEWEVKEYRAAPFLWKDGKPIYPMMFWESYPSEWETKEFTRRGMELFSFFRSGQHYDHPWWKEDGTIDYAFFDNGLREILEYSPQAYLLPRVYYTAPEWWTAKNPGEITQYSAKGKKSKYYALGKEPARESFASEKFRKESGEAYRKLIRHLWQSDYADQILGIHVSSGPWAEHFYWDAYYGSRPDPVASDVSEPMRQALIRYLREKYGDDETRLRKAWGDETLTFQTVQVPSAQQRTNPTAGAWHDPAKSRAVMDYQECHHRAVAETIDYFCRIVKEESDGKWLTMVFYGYTQDENWPLECDHRAISWLLRSPHVDMLSAPHTYYRRRLGEDGEMRQYLASTALHGKLFIDEGDDQTYLEWQKKRPDLRVHVKTREETQALLQREFGNTVTHSVGLWYMDLNGGWFRDEALIDTIGEMKKWADVSMNHSRKRNAEVAIISQPESEFYLGYRQTPNNEISHGLYHHQMREFFHAGAPFDWYLMEDLEAIEEKNYKVYIFLDCFYMSESQRLAVERLKSENRTLLWFYAPGYASQENLSLSRMENLTGFQFQPVEKGKLLGVLQNQERMGIDKVQKSLFTVVPEEGVEILAHGVENLAEKPVLASRQFDTWKSVFCSITGVPRDYLREIYRDAGVHVYCDSGDVLSANESWLMLHTSAEGEKKVRLPRKYGQVTEIVSGKVIGKNLDEFTITLPKHVTAIFLLEP